MSTAAYAISTARARAGTSQSELARRSGIAQSTVSRIERGELDPSWSTMQKLLNAAGWKAAPEATEVAQLIPAATIARAMARSLRKGDEHAAIRDLTEAVGRIIRMGESGEPIPEWVAAKPTKPIGNLAWDTFLATAFAYGLERTGRKAPEWMLEAPPLPEETAPGDDPSPEFREWLRARTPAIFREKNLLSRAEDWAIA